MLTLNILGTRERREALCPTCVYSITQKGFQGEELTSCNLGGTLRELRFTVSECTGYIDRRTVLPAPTAGFVRPQRRRKQNVTVIRIE